MHAGYTPDAATKDVAVPLFQTVAYAFDSAQHGADIVVHPLTMYLSGHGTAAGGAIVDSGRFPWAQHPTRFKRLNESDLSWHGVVYTEALGPAAYIDRARVVPLRNIGAAISPFNAWLILQGAVGTPRRGCQRPNAASRGAACPRSRTAAQVVRAPAIRMALMVDTAGGVTMPTISDAPPRPMARRARSVAGASLGARPCSPGPEGRPSWPAGRRR